MREGSEPGDGTTVLQNNNALWSEVIQNPQALCLEFGRGECLSFGFHNTDMISYDRLHDQSDEAISRQPTLRRMTDSLSADS